MSSKVWVRPLMAGEKVVIGDELYEAKLGDYLAEVNMLLQLLSDHDLARYYTPTANIVGQWREYISVAVDVPTAGNTEEQQYLDILQEIMDVGVRKSNRTGIATKSVFCRTMRFNMKNHFPVVTTKKVYFKGIVEELLLFLRGETNSKKLEEKGVNIWTGNTSRSFLDNLGLNYLPEGEMGCAYPHQWRNFGGEHPLVPDTKGLKGIDQIRRVLEQIRTNPLDRRIYIVGANPAQEKYMALPPCHCYCQFICNPETKELNCFFLIRSNDMFLGWPFNLTQYALLTEIIAKATGYQANELVYTGVDVHLYENHFDAAKEQIARVPKAFPNLKIHKELNTIDDIEALQYGDFELVGYDPYPPIKAEMAV